MNRRDLLMMAGAMGLAPTLARAAEGDATAARDAYLYALPLIEMATTRARVLKAPGAAINRLSHTRVLADHTSRAVTTPNNDTLYSTAFLDLTQGPLTLTIPALGPRYYSVALMDMFTNNNVVLGTRTVGGEGGDLHPGRAWPGFDRSQPRPYRDAARLDVGPHAGQRPGRRRGRAQGSGWLRAERASRRTGCGVCRPRRQARRLFRHRPRPAGQRPGSGGTDLKVLRRTSRLPGRGPVQRRGGRRWCRRGQDDHRLRQGTSGVHERLVVSAAQSRRLRPGLYLPRHRRPAGPGRAAGGRGHVHEGGWR
jgi:hypothetical protein